MTLKMNHFNPIRNQNYSLFFQNSPFASSLWPLNRGLFLPRSLGPKRLHSKWATLAPKIVLYFTHRNGPIFGAKTDLLDLECIAHDLHLLKYSNRSLSSFLNRLCSSGLRSVLNICRNTQGNYSLKINQRLLLRRTVILINCGVNMHKTTN